MALIVERNNPFDAHEAIKTEIDGGITILEWLQSKYPGFQVTIVPTICMVDGNPVLQRNWDKHMIHPDAVVVFIVLPGDALTALYVLYGLFVIAAVVFALTIPKPGGQIDEPDPVYGLKGRRNQNRLSQPIEVCYGRCRLWASFAARSYNKYIGNDQFLYQLFSLGQGEFDIEAIQIEDTAIANFQEVEYEVYNPGEDVTLFPDNVVTSSEVGGIELLGPNEAGYIGAAGPFVANDANTDTDHLEVDVVLPNGLYLAESDGSLGDLQVTALFEYQEIDDVGDPVGSWITLATLDVTLRTNTPQRFTLEADVTPGRYQVRADRTSDKNETASAGNTVRWDTLRAFLPSTKDYGDVTLIAVKARATNNLNDQSANRFNVWATRKLRTRDGVGGWTALTATRSIVWAFADIFQNTKYGGRLADSQLDLDALEALDAVYTSLGWNFDYVFEQRTTLWEAARIIARCGRAVPMLNGSQVTMIRDFLKTVPTAVFNQENIVKGSFSIDIELAGPDDHDGLEIEYTDPNTFLPETVLCLIGSEVGDYPEQIKLPGSTSRTQAYREGLYIRASKLLLKENVTFKTGLEGHIPSYGDLVQIVHDLPKWGQGGLALSIIGTTVTLSEPVVFGVGTHKIIFRKKDGTIEGPITVTAGASPNIVELAAPVGDIGDYFFDNINEFPLFLFGPENVEGTLCVIVGLQPAENGTVEVKAVVKADAVFDGDADDPPALPSTPIPAQAPQVPVMDCSLTTYTVVPASPRKGILSWEATLGATSYKVQSSSNGVNWIDVGVTANSYMEVDVEPGQALYLRVQPIGVGGAGAWCSPPSGTPGAADGEPAPPDQFFPDGGNYADFIDPPASDPFIFSVRRSDLTIISDIVADGVTLNDLGVDSLDSGFTLFVENQSGSSINITDFDEIAGTFVLIAGDASFSGGANYFDGGSNPLLNEETAPKTNPSPPPDEIGVCTGFMGSINSGATATTELKFRLSTSVGDFDFYFRLNFPVF